MGETNHAKTVAEQFLADFCANPTTSNLDLLVTDLLDDCSQPDLNKVLDLLDFYFQNPALIWEARGKGTIDWKAVMKRVHALVGE